MLEPFGVSIVKDEGGINPLGPKIWLSSRFKRRQASHLILEKSQALDKVPGPTEHPLYKVWTREYQSTGPVRKILPTELVRERVVDQSWIPTQWQTLLSTENSQLWLDYYTRSAVASSSRFSLLTNYIRAQESQQLVNIAKIWVIAGG